MMERDQAMIPFEDDGRVKTIGDLSIENGADKVAIHGSLDIERTREGLAKATALLTAVQGIVAALESGELLEAVPPPSAPLTKPNPFRPK